MTQDLNDIGLNHLTFTADEIITTAMLELHPRYRDAEIIRMADTAYGFFDLCEITIGLGSEHCPSQGRFVKEDETSPSFMEMIWSQYGREIVTDFLKNSHDQYDDPDLAEYVFDYMWHSLSGDLIKGLSQTVETYSIGVPYGQDGNFLHAVQIAKEVLENSIRQYVHLTMEYKRAPRFCNGQVLYLSHRFVHLETSLNKCLELKDVKCVIYPLDYDESSWVIDTVHRMSFPKQWFTMSVGELLGSWELRANAEYVLTPTTLEITDQQAVFRIAAQLVGFQVECTSDGEIDWSKAEQRQLDHKVNANRDIGMMGNFKLGDKE